MRDQFGYKTPRSAKHSYLIALGWGSSARGSPSTNQSREEAFTWRFCLAFFKLSCQKARNNRSLSFPERLCKYGCMHPNAMPIPQATCTASLSRAITACKAIIRHHIMHKRFLTFNDVSSPPQGHPMTCHQLSLLPLNTYFIPHQIKTTHFQTASYLARS
jgi:hypothetical protein